MKLQYLAGKFILALGLAGMLVSCGNGNGDPVDPPGPSKDLPTPTGLDYIVNSDRSVQLKWNVDKMLDGKERGYEVDIQNMGTYTDVMTFYNIDYDKSKGYDTEFTWRVRAYSDGAYGAWSEQSVFKTAPRPWAYKFYGDWVANPNVEEDFKATIVGTLMMQRVEFKVSDLLKLMGEETELPTANTTIEKFEDTDDVIKVSFGGLENLIPIDIEGLYELKCDIKSQTVSSSENFELNPEDATMKHTFTTPLKLSDFLGNIELPTLPAPFDELLNIADNISISEVEFVFNSIGVTGRILDHATEPNDKGEILGTKNSFNITASGKLSIKLDGPEAEAYEGIFQNIAVNMNMVMNSTRVVTP